MIDKYICEVREKLNSLVCEEDAELHNGEILILSQKLDKLIFIRETIAIKRSQINYDKELQNFLSPMVFNKCINPGLLN